MSAAQTRHTVYNCLPMRTLEAFCQILKVPCQHTKVYIWMFVKQTKNEKTGRILRRTRNSQVLVLTQLCYHTRHTIIPVTRYTFRTLLDTCLFRDGFHFYANQKPLPRACQFLIRSINRFTFYLHISATGNNRGVPAPIFRFRSSTSAPLGSILLDSQSPSLATVWPLVGAYYLNATCDFSSRSYVVFLASSAQHARKCYVLLIYDVFKKKKRFFQFIFGYWPLCGPVSRLTLIFLFER